MAAESANADQDTSSHEAAGHPLHRVLAPRSLAIIGASADPTKRGFQAIRALRASAFAGPILPVNPRGGQILDLPVYPHIGELPLTPDLALICTPAASVPAVLEDCAAAGIAGAVVLALGFAESGEAGADLERNVAAVARRTGIRVVGPNTSGILNLRIGLNLIGMNAQPGSVGVLVQSGNVLLGLVNELHTAFGEGVSIAVGMGNQTDIGAREYLEYLDLDPGTRVIAMYLENVQDGARFLDIARRVVRRTPVVMLKGGRTEAGRSAARSHTGALAGEFAVFEAAMRQAGVTFITREDELAPHAFTLAHQPPVADGSGVVVLSDGGGHATLAADALGEARVALARLDPDTQASLRLLLGPAAAVANPVDLAGAADRDPRVFAEALRLVLADASTGGVLLAGLFGGYAVRFAGEIAEAEEQAAAAMVDAMRASGRPVVVHSLYAALRTRPIETLLCAGIPAIKSLDAAVRSMSALVERGRTRTAAEVGIRPASPEPVGHAVIEAARSEGREVLLETEARALVQSCGVPLVAAEFCETAAHAEEAARRIGGRIVMKAVSAAAPHKSEAGGVALDVKASDAAEVFDRLSASVSAFARAHGKQPDVRGVLVMPMLPAPVAEVLVGLRRDAVFGPVLTLGLGGTWTELLADVRLRVLPVGEHDVRDMLEETRVGRLLAGWRGGPRADVPALVRLVVALARVAEMYPDVVEVELNPVFANPTGAVAVDVRAFIDRRK